MCLQDCMVVGATMVRRSHQSQKLMMSIFGHSPVGLPVTSSPPSGCVDYIHLTQHNVVVFCCCAKMHACQQT